MTAEQRNALADATWDAAVIGAGPAGSFAALEMARAGLRVLLLDRKKFPRYKVCGCCLNGRALRVLEQAGLEGVVADASPLHAFCVAARRNRVELDLPEGRAISRERFDDSLVKAAVREGATFYDGVHVSLGEFEGHSRALLLHHPETPITIRARVVVAACGLGRTVVEKEPNLDAAIWKHSRFGAGAVVDAHLTQYRPGTICMACGEKGYAGLVRIEDGRLNIAAALDPEFARERGSISSAIESILVGAGFDVPAEIHGVSWRGTPLLTRRANGLGADGVLLVGDAAGYVEPFTGEGIAWALDSARALAPVAVRAVARFDANIVAEWSHAQREITAASQRRCRWLARALRRPVLVQCGIASLRVVPALARPFVAQLNAPSRQPLGQHP